VSPALGQAQREHFASICNNGADCFTATKGLLEVIGNFDGSEQTTVFGQCSLIGILNEGDKANNYFKNSESFIRSQGGPVLAAALKGMVVVAAHKRMSYP